MPQAAVAVASYIYGAVGTAAAAAGASSAAASAIATAAVGVASATAKVALLAGLNAVVAQQNKPRPQGGLINLTINPNEPRRLQIGTRVNAGVLVDWYVTGTRNQRLFMVVYLGEGPMGRILKVIGGGREVYTTPINHGTRTTIPNYRSGGDRLWITYYDGRPGQTADATLTGLSLGWTSACVGTGCAYAIIEALWDSDNQTSPPSIAFEMEGAKLYDRRLDSTAGGSGSHRANDPSTWALSSNPAVALDHYLLGRYTGSIKTFGVGLAAADVPYAPFAARANLCDEDVDRKVSGTLKRYAANGFLFADRTYSDTIRDLCRAMNARPADFGGRIGIIDGEEKTPVLTIADTDLIEGVPESYTPKRSWADLVSVVRGTYQNPAQLYQAGEYPRVTDSAWTAADGGSPKEATLDLEMEIDVERAQRLALLYARRERRQAQLTGTYELRTIELEQGDWFTRTGGIFGAGKTFEVIDRVLDPATLHVTITAFEVDPADSAWDENVAADAPPAAVSNTGSLQAMEVPALTVTGVTLSGTSATLPAIRVQWTAPTDPRVRQIVVEAVPSAGGVPMSQTVDAATAQVVFTNGITDNTAYLVRARFVGDFIPSAWSSNFSVTTSGTYSVGTATSVPWSGLTGTIPNTVANSVVDTRVSSMVGVLTTNSYFDHPTASPGLPFGWSDWQNGSQLITQAKPNSHSGFCMYANATGLGAGAKLGCRQEVRGLTSSTRYVLAATVYRNTGSYKAAGLYVEYYTAAGAYISNALYPFGTSPNTAGVVSNTHNGPVRFEFNLTLPGTADRVLIYAMTAWDGFAALDDPISLFWYECSLIPQSLVGQLGADVTGLNTANDVVTGRVTTTTSSYTAGTGGRTNVGDGWAICASISPTTSGGTVLLSASLLSLLDPQDSGNAEKSVRIRRGSSTIYQATNFHKAFSGEASQQPFCVQIADSPGTGSFTYTLETTYSGTVTSETDSNRSLIAAELKR